MNRCLAQLLLLVQITTHTRSSCSSLFSSFHSTRLWLMTGWYLESPPVRWNSIRGCFRSPDRMSHTLSHPGRSAQEQQKKLHPWWAHKKKQPCCSTKLMLLQRLLSPRTNRPWCYNTSENYAGHISLSFQGFALKKSPHHRIWENW